MVEMKIVAGLGTVDDYEEYVEAGADKLFCGYVPHDYVRRFGRKNPLNRREVMYYNVSVGSESELMILADKIKKYQVPVSIAINGLYFEEEQAEYIQDYVKKCSGFGFGEYIIADEKIIKRLSGMADISIKISGEYGELNEGVISQLSGGNVSGIIFPRQTDVNEMRELISTANRLGLKEFEAFALNEKCHFTGAYCNSLHCDEMCHICKIPYHLNDRAIDEEEVNDRIIGETGCGICKLWKLREVGITELKIVSRGNSTEATKADIRALRSALNILNNCETEAEYIREVKRKLFPDGCSQNCY